MTWFTSTPVSFGGGPDFFLRDSGLVCKGLQSIGLICKSVMPLPNHPGDMTNDLIRVSAEELARLEFWSSIGAEKVVLYSWGAPKYKHIAEAVRDSGAKLFINLDSGGIISPKVTPKLYSQAVLGRQVRLYGSALGSLAGFFRNIAYRQYIPRCVEPGRVAHLKTATAIGCVTPGSMSLWRLWARTYAPELVERMHLVPNPVADNLRFDSLVEKQDIVTAVGRWDDEQQKRPEYLAGSIEEVAKRRSTTEFHIYGNPGRILPSWHRKLPYDIRKRIYLDGKVDHAVIRNTLIRSRIGLCSSSHEGSHVASEEALCAGASIVAPLRNELNALLWYVSHDSGQLAIDDSAQGLADALLMELGAWDLGKRNPVSISNYWRSQLSVSAVADKIRDLLE